MISKTVDTRFEEFVMAQISGCTKDRYSMGEDHVIFLKTLALAVFMLMIIPGS